MEAEPRRLGKRELGPHAFEEQYPPKIAQALEKDGTASFLPGVIPKLGQLLRADSDVSVVYLCTTHVSQAYKSPDEGGHFCGYHNIQMLCSALIASETIAVPEIPERPTIPQLQDLIELAWEKGFNSHGRILTGGIKGTRKHIGTSEAEALFSSLDIPCTGKAFKGNDAWAQLRDSMEEYFTSSNSIPPPERINVTARMPIFLQRPGHSITIIGFVRSKSGKCRLLTFDPAWRPPSKMTSTLQDSECTDLSAKLLIKRYRKSQRYFKRYNAFETLQIDLPK